MNGIGGAGVVPPVTTQQSNGGASAAQQQALFEQALLEGAIATSGFIAFGQAQRLAAESREGVTGD